jgi:hypothetical protein
MIPVHTPLAGAGLSIPAANKQREFAAWVEAKEVRNTQFTDWLRHRSEPFELNDIEVGASYAPFNATTVSGTIGTTDLTFTLTSTALLRPGDQYRLKQYYSGSTTEFDDTKTERGTILTVPTGTTITVERQEYELTTVGPFNSFPIGSTFTVVSRAQNYATPFPDAYSFRGDSVLVHTQRFDSGEITYDLAAVSTPDFEAPNGHYMKDIMYWKNELPHYRNDAFINGRKRTGDFLTAKPYRLSGAIWWAEQLATNLYPVNGLLNIFDFSDVWEDLETNHTDGPGDTIWMAPRMRLIWNEMLLPYKGMWGPNETGINMTIGSVKNAFGNIPDPKTDNQWPPSKILITSRSDFFYTNMQGMNWTYVERSSKELGMFAKSWTMGGDFGLVCENMSHQRLLTGVDTRKDLYPARTSFL